jgi:hypothetical protein
VKDILLLSALLAAVGVIPHAANTAARNVEIVGVDYAFKTPSSLPAGRTTFAFRNSGKQYHELNIFLLKPGFSIEDIVKARKEGKSQLPMIEGAVGVLFADPASNAPARLSVDLKSGRDYGVLCIFRDSAKAPRHYEMGMYSVIHVTGATSATPAMAADSVVAVDYAYTKYPREISPGVHSLVFRNAGKHRHEISIALLKKGVTLDSVVAVDKRDGDVDDLFEKNGGIGVLHSAAGVGALGRIVVDFLPGREYLVDCSFSDDDKSPPHYKLGMYGSIKVRPAKRATQ